MLRTLAAVVLMIAMLAIAALALTPLGFTLALQVSGCHPALVDRWLPWQGSQPDGGCQ